MFGKELNQLMTGIDYGGVEIKSFDFGGIAGYDSQPWFTDTWDTYENTFEDEVFTADGSTIAVQLSTPLEDGVVYNLYKNGVRIDDPNFSLGSATNAYAITDSITGDGVADTIYVQDLGITLIIENHYKDDFWTEPEFAQMMDVFVELVGRIDSPWFDYSGT